MDRNVTLAEDEFITVASINDKRFLTKERRPGDSLTDSLCECLNNRVSVLDPHQKHYGFQWLIDRPQGQTHPPFQLEMLGKPEYRTKTYR